MADERLHHPGGGRRGQGEADRHARTAQSAAGHRAVLRRGDSQAPRTASTARRCCTSSGLSVTTTLDATLQEAANAAVESGLRRLDKRRGCTGGRGATSSPKAHAIDTFTDERWNRPIAAGDVVPAVVVTAPKTRPGAASDRPLSGRPGARGLRLDAPRVGGRSVQAGRSHRRAGRSRSTTPAATASVAPRADARRRSRARGHRQPLRPDSRDGRRVELRPQQVQSRGAGLPAARIDLQADRLHDGDRSRLHARVHARRRARQLSGRAAPRSTARRTTTTSSRGRSRCAMRSRTRAIFRPSR